MATNCGNVMPLTVLLNGSALLIIIFQSIAYFTQRKKMPQASDTPVQINVATPHVLTRIRTVIDDTDVPSWIRTVPKNYGDAAAGTLKADEWRTLATIYFPLALVSLWGEGMDTGVNAGLYRRILDHTMLLVSAIRLACLRIMTKSRIERYKEQITKYVSELPNILEMIHSNETIRPNHNASLHIYD